MDTRTGRIVADAKAVNVNGKVVVNFTIAINRNYRKKGTNEEVKLTEYVECRAWNRERLAPHLLKGKLVEVLGNIGVRAYPGKDNHPKGVMTMDMRELKFHNSGGRTNAAAPVAAPAGADITEPLDDLPF